jgi:hypothetical protein
VRLHREKRWLAAVPVIIVACMALVLGMSHVAYASAASQVCAQNGTGYCMNDWGGFDMIGDTVAMYHNDNTNNNDFAIQQISGCSGPGGAPCVQIVYLPSDGVNCLAGENAVGDPTYSADLGGCGDASQGGNGASYGVIQWLTSPSWCSDGGAGLENRYWSQKLDEPLYLQSGGSIGAAVNLEGSDDNGSSCWAEVV